MSDDDNRHEAPTRRDYVKYGGAIVGSGLLAGCSSDTGVDATDTSSTSTATATAAETTKESGKLTETSEVDVPYSVTMAPAGTVEFTEVPDSTFVMGTHHAGMAVALGHGDNINAMYAAEYYSSIWNKFLHRLEGVSVDWSDLPSAWNPDKELLYELDSGVHLIDPAYMTQMKNYGREDVREVTENISPVIGNQYSDGNTEPPEDWADEYEYYTLWEMFGKVARIYQAEDKYEALSSIYADMRATIETNIPPESERPRTAMALLHPEDETLTAYPMNGPGFTREHTRPLEANDVFEGMEFGADIDYEGLLEADPDVLLCLEIFSQDMTMIELREHLKNDPVASTVSAVKNDRVYAQGARYHGPILDLFQLEMGAKELYPEQFGEWPGYVDGPYPEIAEEEQLFDRQRVADVIEGEI